jgi:hypothetical protein
VRFFRCVRGAKIPGGLLALVLAVAGGCTAMTSSVAPPVTSAMVQSAHGVSVETLQQGRRIFSGPCTTCHNADPVAKYSVAEWRAIVDDDMGARARLTAAERSALMAYINAARSP